MPPSERIDAVELKPFEAAIAHGVDAVMTAHMAVPAIEPDDIPATASPKVLTGLLRNDLGFNGLIVTDALDMLGFAKQFSGGEGPVRAIEAGADVLLMPPDPEKAIHAVLAAIQSGRITRQRIDDSVMRVLAAKIRVGVFKKKLVDLDEVSDVLDSPDADERVQQMSDRAVTLVKNDRSLVPLAPDRSVPGGYRRAADCRSTGSGWSANFAGARRAGARRFVDPSMPLAALEADVGDTSACSAMIVAMFSTGGTLERRICQRSWIN